MNSFDYLVAEGVEAALGEYAGGQAALKAGGIDLLDLMKEGVESPGTVLSIDRLEELRYIREEADGVHIGALTTLAELGRSELLRERYSALHKAAASAATPQVRERATVAGNLCQRPRCWYYRNIEFNCLKKGGGTCFAVEGENQYHAIFGGGPCHIVHPSNIAPALVALDGELVVRRGEEEAQRIHAEEFFVLPRESMYAENVLRPGQMITEIVLPRAPARSATVELREKQSFDWPIASASVAEVEGVWRVVLGAVAPIPWVSRAAMEVVGGSEITPELAARAGEAAVEEAEPMSDNGYKVQLVKVVVRRALMSAARVK